MLREDPVLIQLLPVVELQGPQSSVDAIRITGALSHQIYVCYNQHDPESETDILRIRANAPAVHNTSIVD